MSMPSKEQLDRLRVVINARIEVVMHCLAIAGLTHEAPSPAIDAVTGSALISIGIHAVLAAGCSDAQLRKAVDEGIAGFHERKKAQKAAREAMS